jgi:hypothetical protein
MEASGFKQFSVLFGCAGDALFPIMKDVDVF